MKVSSPSAPTIHPTFLCANKNGFPFSALPRFQKLGATAHYKTFPCPQHHVVGARALLFIGWWGRYVPKKLTVGGGHRE